MSQVKISQLPSLTLPTITDLFPLVSNGITKQIKLTDLLGNIPTQVKLNNRSLTSGTGVLLRSDTSYDAQVPDGSTLSLLYFKNHNTSPTGGLFQGIKIITDSEKVDTAAGISITNIGMSDALYINMQGKSGITASSPTGLGIDMNEGSGGNENSTVNTGNGIQVWDWSQTDTATSNPTAIYLKKVNNLNTRHDLIKLVANRYAIEMITPAGAGYDGTQPILTLASKFNLTAAGSIAGVGYSIFGVNSLSMSGTPPNGSIGVISDANTTLAYLTTSSGFGNLISRKNDFGGTGRGLKIATKSSQGTTIIFDSSGNVAIGENILNTNASDGFLYIPTCSGAPIGTPTNKTGLVPMVYDSINNNFYFYNGGWKKTTAFS